MRTDCGVDRQDERRVTLGCNLAAERALPILMPHRPSPLFLPGLLLAASLCACPAQESADPEQARALEGVAIRPSRTDPAIQAFDFAHYLHVDRDIVIRGDKAKPAARGELLVWLTGTGGRGRGAGEFCRLAASQGYHVLKVMYPTDIPATVCKRDPDPTSFERFRTCLIAGGSCAQITVARVDSIEHRLIQLLKLLAKTRAREQWGQFLQPDASLRWDKIVPAGQSQGGGHAFLIGMQHRVARVIGTGAPKDWSPRLPGPAPWLLGPSATPKDRFFSFNHTQDQQGATPDQQWQILRAFDPAAKIVSIDSRQPLDPRARHLSTDHPGTPLESTAAHTSVIADRNAQRLRPVWLHLLTAPLAPAASP